MRGELTVLYNFNTHRANQTPELEAITHSGFGALEEY